MHEQCVCVCVCQEHNNFEYHPCRSGDVLEEKKAGAGFQRFASMSATNGFACKAQRNI